MFELHLAVCRECRTCLAAYRQTVAVGRAAFHDPDASVPDDVPEDLVKAVMAARAADPDSPTPRM